MKAESLMMRCYSYKLSRIKTENKKLNNHTNKTFALLNIKTVCCLTQKKCLVFMEKKFQKKSLEKHQLCSFSRHL